MLMLIPIANGYILHNYEALHSNVNRTAMIAVFKLADVELVHVGRTETFAAYAPDERVIGRA